LSDVGKLPDNLELFHAEAEMIRVAVLMEERMEAVVAGDCSAEDAARFFREIATSKDSLAAFEQAPDDG
jgi:hypothetical protein